MDHPIAIKMMQFFTKLSLKTPRKLLRKSGVHLLLNNGMGGMDWVKGKYTE